MLRKPHFFPKQWNVSWQRIKTNGRYIQSLKKLDIFLMTTGLTGRLYSTFEAARRLEKAGNQVTFACPWDRKEIISKHGFKYIQLPESALRFQNFDTEEAALHSLGVDLLPEIIKSHAPDLLLIDCELPAHIIASLKCNIPIVILFSWLNIYRVPKVAPITTTIIPGQGLRGGRFGIKLSWWIQNARKSWFHFKQQLKYGKRTRRRILLKYAASQQINLTEYTDHKNFIILPYYWKSLPSISMNLLEFDFAQQLPPHFRYVGSMVYLERKLEEEKHPGYPHFMRVLAKAKKAGHKIIYCSLSTMAQTATDVLINLDKVMLLKPNWTLLLSKTKNDMAFTPSANNMYLYEWVPQITCLEMADLSLNTSGINTINECIEFKVPMLIHNLGINDLNGSAARVAYHGLGCITNLESEKTDKIIQMMQSLMNDQHYKNKLEAMNKVAMAYRMEGTIANHVQEIYENYSYK